MAIDPEIKEQITTGRNRLADLAPIPGVGDAEPLVFWNLEPQTGEEKMHYALGYDGARFFEAVPPALAKWVDLGRADKAAGRSPRVVWVQEKAVVNESPDQATASSPVPFGASPEEKDPPVWPLLLGGGALTAGLVLLAVSRKKKRNV